MVLEEIQLKSDIQKIERLKKGNLAAKASQKSKIEKFEKVMEREPKYIENLQNIITILDDNPLKVEPKPMKKLENTDKEKQDNGTKIEKKPDEAKEKINHNIKVYGSADEFISYPNYVLAAAAIKEKIELRGDELEEYPLFNYRDIDFEMDIKQESSGFLISGNALFIFPTIDIKQDITFVSSTINLVGFFSRVNNFLRNMGGYLAESTCELKNSKSGLEFINQNNDDKEVFTENFQEKLLTPKNRHDSVLTELQNSESDSNKERGCVASFKFIRSSDDTVDVLVFNSDQGEYINKATLANSPNNNGWALEGKKFECLYQAKLKAYHLFNDGIVFEGGATEELPGTDSYFFRCSRLY
ncbi:MAG: hypothetical protein Rpha_1275 [Candidatus Ruthia sp. Apha_13_S6]|nr:hypothetical protein [Candidatus Ruthia sp. Apha_13_S6]